MMYDPSTVKRPTLPNPQIVNLNKQLSNSRTRGIIVTEQTGLYNEGIGT